MSQIKVVEAHTLGANAAQAKLAVFEEMLKKYGVKTKWKRNHADIKGMGVSGSIDVTDSDATIVVKLGMMARAAGVDPARLESSIRKRVKEAFGS